MIRALIIAGLALIASPLAAQAPQFGATQVALDPLAATSLYGPSPYAYAKANISERTLADGQVSIYGGGGLIGDERVSPLVKGLPYAVYTARPMTAAERAAVAPLVAVQEKAGQFNAPLKAALLNATWLSGARSSPKTYGYGRYRTVYRGCRDAACWNAPLWLFNRTHFLEIDIEIIKSGTQMNAAIHSTAGSKGVRIAMPDPSKWHTIGFDWLPGLVIWYIDEIAVARLAYPLTDASGRAVDGPAFVNSNLAIGSKDCANWVCMPTAQTRTPLAMTITPITYAPLLNAPGFVQ